MPQLKPGTADYTFDPYRARLSSDWYADDGLLQRLLDRYSPESDRSRLVEWGPVVAGRLRELAEASARPENSPRLRTHDAYGNRVDAIDLPPSTVEALSVAAGQAGLGAVRGDAFVHYAMIYLLSQNGEAGVVCSLACTDGLVRAVETLGDRPVHAAVAAAVRKSRPERWVQGAQFVTEIQGGSDVPANEARAVADGEAYRVHGRKWFCSNINADWFLVTARAEGDAPLGLFLVPAYAADAEAWAGGEVPEAGVAETRGDGDRRNGFVIERLKDKLGTRELATAELTFEGARAWPVGSLTLGLSNLLRYVLTPSRYFCVLFAAAALRRAERIAGEYARFREAFGQPIARYPLVARSLSEIREGRAQALGCAFELLRLWRSAEENGYRSLEAQDFRILLSLAKPVLTRRATSLLHEAMMVLGGNGIEERFSPLPRLYRDSAIMETWEGAHNVLYTQALRDLLRFEVDPVALVERTTGAPGPEIADRLTAAMAAAERESAGDEEAAGTGAVILADVAPALVAAMGSSAVSGAVARA